MTDKTVSACQCPNHSRTMCGLTRPPCCNQCRNFDYWYHNPILTHSPKTIKEFIDKEPVASPDTLWHFNKPEKPNPNLTLSPTETVSELAYYKGEILAKEHNDPFHYPAHKDMETSKKYCPLCKIVANVNPFASHMEPYPSNPPTETTVEKWKIESDKLLKYLHGNECLPANFDEVVIKFVALSVQEAKAEVIEKMKKLKPRGFGFDEVSMNMGYMMALGDVKHLLKEKA